MQHFKIKCCINIKTCYYMHIPKRNAVLNETINLNMGNITMTTLALELNTVETATTETATKAKKATAKPKAEIRDVTADLAQIQKALDHRFEVHMKENNVASNDIIKAIKFFSKEETALAVLTNCAKKGFDYSRFVNNLHITEKGDTFIAVKVIEKIYRLMQAVAGNAHKLDGYTKAVLFNVAQGLDNMTTFEIQQAMSNQVVNELTADRLSDRKVINRKSSGASTASTQSSSSRMCLLYLDIANTEKGKKDAVLEMKLKTKNGKAFMKLAEELFQAK